MIGKDEEVELPELDKILTKYMTGESKRSLWPYLSISQRHSRSASSPYEEEEEGLLLHLTATKLLILALYR